MLPGDCGGDGAQVCLLCNSGVKFSQMDHKTRHHVSRRDRSSTNSADRRQARRHQLAQPAEMGLGEYSGVVEALDLSKTGVRCCVSTGFAPFEGDRAVVTFVDGTARSGYVRWTRGSEFGLEFDFDLQDPNDLLHVECWDDDNYSNLLRFQSKFAR